MSEPEPDWTRLFPDQDFSFRFGFNSRSAEEFFGPTPDGAGLLAERSRWLDETPERYCGLLPEGEPILREVIEMAGEWAGLNGLRGDGAEGLGRRLEPDFILLCPDKGTFIFAGGCVCFPSSWGLADKLGRPLVEVHEPVPGLNAGYGQAIGRYLSRIPPGPALLRANWGLSRSAELNQHPDRELPRLGASVRAEDVYLRIEHQALVALPRTGGILFGIRLEIVALTEVIQYPRAARALGRSLATMPAAVADYKGLTAARATVIELLGFGTA